MEFRTKINIPKDKLRIDHQTKLMLFGSCFVENIGSHLLQNKFNAHVNPFGVLYNPASIGKVLRRIIDGEDFTESDLFLHNGLYASFLHHGSFSDPDKERCLFSINQALNKASNELKHTQTLIITFGTAYTYSLTGSDKIVANCHKLPADRFNRCKLSVNDIVADWSLLIESLREQNNSLNILFTLSPIRHWKDGAHENQLSKATLMLAIDTLQHTFEGVSYFPSYEIVMDELRDYRFYAEDMIHISDLAIKYIWNSFGDTYFDQETNSIIKQWNIVRQAIHHRPFNSDTTEHQEFLRQTLLKINTFQDKYPYIECGEEKQLVETQID